MAKDDAPKQELNMQSIEELRYLQQVYQNQYTVLSNSINMLLGGIRELNSAQKTLENLDLVKNKDTLTGIGGDFYLKGKVESTEKVLVGVGAGYVIEKDTDSAKTLVADLIKKNTDNLNRISKNRKELEGALIDISYRLDNIR